MTFWIVLFDNGFEMSGKDEVEAEFEAPLLVSSVAVRSFSALFVVASSRPGSRVHVCIHVYVGLVGSSVVSLNLV